MQPTITGELIVAIRQFIGYYSRYKQEAKRLAAEDPGSPEAAWFRGLSRGYLSAARLIGWRLKYFRDMEGGQ